MFNILAVSGSPRRGGNTETLVRAALEPFEQGGHRVHRFFLSEKEVAPCDACDACEKDGRCVIEDDMEWLLDNLLSFDAILIGSPVYNRNVSAQLLALFNRFHCITHRHPFQGRVCFGGAIAVGGSPNSQGITLTVIHNFLLSLGVACVPAVLNGVSVVAREKGAVLEQPKSLNDARVLGENLLRFLSRK
jgi:multimeric flavodoxin WrbA